VSSGAFANSEMSPAFTTGSSSAGFSERLNLWTQGMAGCEVEGFLQMGSS
jgi:hypothetical protein